MNGNVFVIDTCNNIKKRGGSIYDPPWESWQIAPCIPACDWVMPDPEYFDDYCQYFQEEYDLHGHIQRKVLNTHPVYEVEVIPLVRALKKQKKERMENIRAEIEKDSPDMWKLHHTAWTDSQFWFLTPDGGLIPEMGFLNYLESLDEPSILIVFSYAYQHTL